MAKNYSAIYNSTNDSSALEQRFYVKLEASKGQLIAPANADYIWTLGGGSVSFNQPFESSPHRSGRHHTDIIKKKKETSWNFSTYFNIDETLGAAASTEVDTGFRLLMKSLMGFEDVSAGAVYNTSVAPDLTFSLFEVGDKWARQCRGAFVMSGNMQFPGNGEAMTEWSGNAVEALLIGIGKSTISNNGANTVTVQTGEGDFFRVGGLVMIIEANGTTRSADTAAGSARTITAISGDVITLSGAVLADADGSSTPIYLCYYEPAAPTAINNPVTGLVGSMSIVGLPSQCFRSASVNINNEHELVDYCYGNDALAAPFFVPGSRVTAEISVEMNLNKDTIAFFNRVQDFDAQDLQIILGSASGRRLVIDAPKVRFPVPAFSVPDTGSIPVTFTGNAYQTALDAADEVTVSFI